MHTKKKAVEFLLYDGSMDGIVLALRKGSNTKTLKIPRDHLADAADLIHECDVGVYCIFYEKEVIGVETLYVGESSNAAASVVLGNSSNGRLLWKTAGGVKLGDL